jgi:hypothetical protein
LRENRERLRGHSGMFGPIPVREDGPKAWKMSQAIEPTTISSRGATHVTGRSPHTADILDRLARLRLVLPALGQELATARREAAKLRVENGRLKDRLHSLEAKRGVSKQGD